MRQYGPPWSAFVDGGTLDLIETIRSWVEGSWFVFAPSTERESVLDTACADLFYNNAAETPNSTTSIVESVVISLVASEATTKVPRVPRAIGG